MSKIRSHSEVEHQGRHDRAEEPVCLFEVLEQCRQGDGDAWEMFVTLTARRIGLYILREVRRTSLSYVVDLDLIADLTQDVYIRLIGNQRRVLREFRGVTERSLSAYLARVAASVVADHRRMSTCQKRYVELISLDERTADSGEREWESMTTSSRCSPEAHVTDRELREHVSDLLKNLPFGRNRHRDALIFTLYAIDGLSTSEIANLPTFNMKVSRVDTIVSRTRARLRKWMETNASFMDDYR